MISYRDHVLKMRKILPMFVSGLFAPPVPFGTFLSILEQSRPGRELIGIMNKSAFDIVDSMFECEKLKNHFLKYASEAMAGPEEKGTGLIFNLLVGFVHRSVIPTLITMKSGDHFSLEFDGLGDVTLRAV